jgi:hypothetical protein
LKRIRRFEVVGAFDGGEAVEERADAPPGVIDASRFGRVQQAFILANTCSLG